MQEKLIQYILSPIDCWMSKMSEKNRERLFLTGGVCLILHFFVRNARLDSYRYLIFFAISCVFMGMMILGSMGNGIKPVKFQKFLWLSWLGVGIFTIPSGILLNSSYLPEAVLFLVAFPILFICWSNAEKQKIIELLLKSAKISFIAFIVLSFLFAKITDKRYAGIFENTNSTAYYLAVIGTCLIVNIFYAKGLRWKTISDMILLAITIVLNYLTNSRTGTLGILVVLFAGVVMYILTHGWKKCLAKVTCIAVPIVVGYLSVAVVLVGFQMRSWLPIPYYDLESGWHMDDKWEELFEKDPDSEEDPEQEDPEQEDPDQEEPKDEKDEFFGLDGYKHVNDLKNDTEGKTMDSYSTGRISVWKYYASKLNLLGHEETERAYIDIIYREISSTHMTILQVAYESGILAGIFYFILNIASGIYAIIYAWKNREEKYAMFPLLLILVFGVLSMLGSCRVTFWYLCTMYYYFALFPIMTKEKEMN